MLLTQMFGIRPEYQARALRRRVVDAFWAVSMLAVFASAASAQTMKSSAVEVKPDWIAKRCMLQIDPDQYEACVRAIAAAAPPFDPAKRDHFGELYDPKKYVDCRLKTLRNDVSCEVYILRRREQPEYWPYPDVPKPKYPEPPNPPTYKPGMTSEQYFKALCEREAGEFIYRTVENVEGLYQIRPRLEATSQELRDRYVLEDPYGYTWWEANRPATIFVSPPWRIYQYFEAPSGGDTAAMRTGAKFIRSSGYQSDGTTKSFVDEYGYSQLPRPMNAEARDDLAARYGYTWREIRRPHDRELGIVGGELVVVDLKTAEILEIRRGFARSGTVSNVRGGFQWEIAQVCPILRPPPAWPKNGDFAYWFVSKVLQPSQQAPRR